MAKATRLDHQNQSRPARGASFGGQSNSKDFRFKITEDELSDAVTVINFSRPISHACDVY